MQGLADRSRAPKNPKASITEQKRKRFKGLFMNKRWLFFFLKISIALVAMLILIKTVTLSDIYSAFRNPEKPIFILLAIFLLFPNLLLQWYRWHCLLRLIKPEVTFFESVSSLFGGMVVGFVTPGRIGEVGRPLFLKEVDRLQAVGLVFIDKFYAFVTILIGGIWGLTLLIMYLANYTPFLVWPLCVIALMVSGGSIVIALHPDWMRSLLYNFSLLLTHRDKMKRFIIGMEHFQKKQAKSFLIFSFLLYGIYILQFCFLAFAFQPISWTTALTATTATIFTKTLIPVSLADLGVREGASLYFFLQFHVEKVTAFNSSILLFSINVLIPTLFGLFFLHRLSWKED